MRCFGIINLLPSDIFRIIHLLICRPTVVLHLNTLLGGAPLPRSLVGRLRHGSAPDFGLAGHRGAGLGGEGVGRADGARGAHAGGARQHGGGGPDALGGPANRHWRLRQHG